MNHLKTVTGTFLAAVLTVVVSNTVVSKSESQILHGSAPVIDESLGSENIRYKSATFGYELLYPSDWSLDDSRTLIDADIIRDPEGRAVLTIGAEGLTHALSQNEIGDLAQSILDLSIFGPTFVMKDVETREWHGRRTVVIDGIVNTGGNRYVSKEYIVSCREMEKVITVSVLIEQRYSEEYRDQLHSIVEGLEFER